MDEFDLIRRFFRRPAVRSQTRFGVGDDAALLDPPPGQVLAATVDTMVAGVHFFPDADPAALGHKLLAVNLSDLAAMGAEPAWALLALALPEANPDWLSAFAEGLFALAGRYRVDLVGGDTIRGPLTLSLQALGWVPEGQALRRCGARPGDGIYVSGTLGDAALGLKMLRGELGWRDETAVERLLRPRPRVALGLALRGLAHACIDVSDGLAADLGHILTASGVGAVLEWESLPLSAAVRRYVAETGDWRLPLSGGDDYELCFTLPEAAARVLQQRLPAGAVAWHRIGTIQIEQGLSIKKGGKAIPLPPAGYCHFEYDDK
ncbi:thiamine-monophosphate kinase [Methylomarinovum caldicuralii]|uniref:Thiamine-monophosphate kinase n=1 Tax=Methylomarinovum caldicuralii TaxID=438856 RepID=A0AAU9CFT2_9GAMM|nr:thiamine-phosphate kinase [Methylomarinovum caldicuralii]BCX81815.1 thiamine-monophosphate kinase [Methylomarinovum caldicuralii]